MKYLCLIYNDDGTLDPMTEAEARLCVDEHLDYCEALKKNGHFIAAADLEPREAAAIVRVRHNRLSTDGPFAETKEQLGGFFLVEAIDLNDAIQVAAKIPSARTGSIEVRPVRALMRS